MVWLFFSKDVWQPWQGPIAMQKTLKQNAKNVTCGLRRA